MLHIIMWLLEATAWEVSELSENMWKQRDKNKAGQEESYEKENTRVF